MLVQGVMNLACEKRQGFLCGFVDGLVVSLRRSWKTKRSAWILDSVPSTSPNRSCRRLPTCRLAVSWLEKSSLCHMPSQVPSPPRPFVWVGVVCTSCCRWCDVTYMPVHKRAIPDAVTSFRVDWQPAVAGHYS